MFGKLAHGVAVFWLASRTFKFVGFYSFHDSGVITDS